MLKFLGATDLLRSAIVFLITMRFHEQPYNNNVYRLIYWLILPLGVWIRIGGCNEKLIFHALTYNYIAYDISHVQSIGYSVILITLV